MVIHWRSVRERLYLMEHGHKRTKSKPRQWHCSCRPSLNHTHEDVASVIRTVLIAKSHQRIVTMAKMSAIAADEFAIIQKTEKRDSLHSRYSSSELCAAPHFVGFNQPLDWTHMNDVGCIALFISMINDLRPIAAVRMSDCPRVNDMPLTTNSQSAVSPDV